mmetsp:Transcript_21666/g.60327  ORF Transcript_21666/g.60327 Transcript_21666/m.60327 type:complete len:168 (+) Transcript_21666:570-1073(+)
MRLAVVRQPHAGHWDQAISALDCQRRRRVKTQKDTTTKQNKPNLAVETEDNTIPATSCIPPLAAINHHPGTRKRFGCAGLHLGTSSDQSTNEHVAPNTADWIVPQSHNYPSTPCNTHNLVWVSKENAIDYSVPAPEHTRLFKRNSPYAMYHIPSIITHSPQGRTVEK